MILTQENSVLLLLSDGPTSICSYSKLEDCNILRYLPVCVILGFCCFEKTPNIPTTVSLPEMIFLYILSFEDSFYNELLC